MEEYLNVLSMDRLKSYEILCPNQGKSNIIGAYHWNLLISQALYPFIHSVEIALRNSIHHAATQKFQTEFWFEFVIKDGKSKSILTETKNDLSKRFENFSASDIVAGLTFGFWTTLIKQKTYTDQFNPHRLWPDLIPSVFPHYARGNDDRKNISKRFEEIRLIRNRLFHHEPIWKFKKANTPQECIAELRRKFNDIFKAIGWMSTHKRNNLREFGFVEFFKNHCTLEVLESYCVKGSQIQHLGE
ncbi:Abi-like protein [Legionella quinlivanii]|uniref:Abi-like protein n=1 Tax=Legionella quinlivanii TaxID=45073 RepID=A0A0W0XTZ0_9GAMM|nr:Abi family protein [Legionella quinlivanii]KTD47903.1 Abi-like protein [Legionella quinlivanii]SEG37038.1 Abi-like protein [Legionella quinlivanii DSM 21216]STY10103.1 Abi-like protein [Legionella quinlivanii]